MPCPPPRERESERERGHRTERTERTESEIIASHTQALDRGSVRCISARKDGQFYRSLIKDKLF